MTNRAYYADLIHNFLDRSSDEILGALSRRSAFSIEATQRDAWLEQIRLLRISLEQYRGQGKVYFEYAVPRLGKRIDVVVLIRHVIFIIEFKVGEKEFTASATDQVWDYALDLKNFHETTHDKAVAPVLVATRSKSFITAIAATPQNDAVLLPIHASPDQLSDVFEQVLSFCDGSTIDAVEWELGRYRPTPTIIEAAMALYAGHAVAEISRRDADAINLSQTSDTVAEIIRSSRELSKKSICFVTGVPGAGKTLV